MVDLETVVNADHAFTEHQHRELLPGIDHLHAVALAVGTLARGTLCDQLLNVVNWIERVVEPHIDWEEATVYPEVDHLAGSHWATSTMRFEHIQLHEQAVRLRLEYEELRTAPFSGRLGDLRGRLFAFEAVLKAHLQREEALILPLLDA